MISSDPLTDAELDRLNDFLMREEGLSDPMDSAMLDGYLTAVVSGPNLVMPSEWLRWVWDTENGQESPEFHSQQEAQEIIGLIMRLYQSVNATLNEEPQNYEPCIMEREHEGRVIPIIDEWCMGYYQGMALDLKAWSLLVMGQPQWFSTILLYGTDDGWEVLKKQPSDLDAHQAKADSLADAVRQIHAFWLAQRRQQIARGDVPGVNRRQEPVRSTAKPGRNEPCACGSGRKYKHCHGAN
ncbi:UPF0149 family protein [Polaromonas sp.]|uniref:UPF0149 family protein n=1 Tax=Polaromonas sp. TaxID=1869339 RepID=UPI00356A8DFF